MSRTRFLTGYCDRWGADSRREPEWPLEIAPVCLWSPTVVDATVYAGGSTSIYAINVTVSDEDPQQILKVHKTMGAGETNKRKTKLQIQG